LRVEGLTQGQSGILIVNTIETILDLNAQNKPIKYIRAYLTMEGYSDKEATELLKEAEIGGKKAGFAVDFYAFLAECERYSDEVKDFILDPNNSKNVKAHLSHYTNIADLARQIWAAK
jgi:hypothetical protein